MKTRVGLGGDHFTKRRRWQVLNAATRAVCLRKAREEAWSRVKNGGVKYDGVRWHFLHPG